MKRLKLFFVFSTLVAGVFAQNSKVQFNGVARGNLENNWLPSSDTSNIDENNKGDVFLDLAMTVKPNDFVKISSTVRLSNQIGGYWGNGSAITLRQLSMKGLAGRYFKYTLGDVDLKMTPYTFFNNDGDANVNEGEVFKSMREICEEENFNNGNYWRQQGAHVATRLGFDHLIQSADVDGFLVRNRSYANALLPDRLHAGARSIFNINDKSFIGVNYVNLFDVPGTIAADSVEKLENEVLTGNFNFDFKYFYAMGEAGISALRNQDSSGATSTNIEGNFFDVGVGRKFFANQLSIEASFRRVSDDFYSAAAQTKRIDYTIEPELFSSVTNSSLYRSLGLFDIMRDESIYNQEISPILSSYNLTYDYITPYGQATPNRKGYTLDVQYKDTAEKYATGVKAQVLQDVRGEGTEALRDYMLVRWTGTVHFNKVFNFKRTLVLTAGLQYGTSKREETSTIKIQEVDAHSSLVDLGVEIEVLKRLDLLAGTKIAAIKGWEYKTVRDEFNEITDYTQVYLNQDEMLHSAALRYRINDNIYLKLQGNYYESNDKTYSAYDYSFQQVFLLFNMMF